MSTIIGIHPGHNATATLLKDGRVVSCIGEERFNREKNYTGFPIQALEYTLREYGIAAQDVDAYAIAGRMPTFFLLPSTPQLTMRYGLFTGIKRRAAEMEMRFPAIKAMSNYYLEHIVPRQEYKRAHAVDAAIAEKLRIDQGRIHRFGHHLTHTATAYYGMCPQNEPVLIFSADGGGDMLCSMVSIGENGSLREIAHTPDWSSLGGVYSAVTQYLGMKPTEHEYKVMGMAPYAKEKYFGKASRVFRDLLWLDEERLTFHSKFRTYLTHQYLKTALEGERFDTICGAVQQFTEDFLLRWVKAGIKKTGIRTIALTGGVFMNVKANMLLANLPEVEKIYIFPSCGDESIAMGAAFLQHKAMEREGKADPIQPIRDLYLGSEYSDRAITGFVEQERLAERFTVTTPDDIEYEVAKLLANHKVVARFKGRMEWGARALGNRSILANPSNFDNIRIINEQIKSRDFWMPFAGSILAERAKDYLVNPRGLQSPYMIITFPTTELAQREMRAAMHPYDFTIRPQIVEKDWNPSYHHLIEEFQKLTGIGGVLNTSFNLHGEPLVCSPADALHTFADSGLEYLAINQYLIAKR